MTTPRLFGSYMLLHQLAKGSTSDVYLARTMGEFSRLCTVKVIRPDLAGLPNFSKRFRHDARLLVRLIHGKLVQVLEVGQADDAYFIAMEHIDGIDLPELLVQTAGQEPLPSEMALFVGLEMCEALNYIHLRRREVEGTSTFPHDSPWPLELMVSFDGVVKVIDLGSFGAVRLGQQKVSHLFRSPGYAVPEVILRKGLDTRSDVFAVGQVIWELLEGRPLMAQNARNYVREVLADSWRAPLIERRDVPGDVIRLVAGMLNLKPDKRPRHLEEVRDPLVGALRRLSPAYGSAALSGLLWARCQSYISRMEATIAEASQSTFPEITVGQDSHSESFGQAGEVDREVAEPTELQVGQVIPGTRYKMLGRLGKGWSGEVFAAQHADLERKVAIKILSPDLARRSKAIEFFRMEARACSRVGHPNIVEVVDFGELSDGRVYFAMELLEGESLAQVLRREKTLPSARVIAIFRQVAKAMAAVHENGIIHRDLKPQNIMLVNRENRADFVKILDFGGKAFVIEPKGTSTKQAGTTGYMAPELVKGGSSTLAMDIYSTGVMMYQALSGELPYPASTHEEFVKAQASGAPPALRTRAMAQGVPVELERVVHRALERDAAARQPSMADLELELIQAQRAAKLVTPYDDLPDPDQLQDQRRRFARPSTKRRFGANQWVITGATVGALVVIILIIALSMNRPPDPGPGEKDQARTQSRPLLDASPGLPREVLELLRQADRAAAQGHFTRPQGSSALDLLEQVERRVPGTPAAAELRQRLARLLEGAADRLASARMPDSARTLYHEAFLFDPRSEHLEKLAYPENTPQATPAGQRLQRPAASAADVAWLLSRVQLAVVEGRYVSPEGNNALYFLKRLKQVDPSGALSTAARESMSLDLRERADSLRRTGQQTRALEIEETLTLLGPGTPPTPPTPPTPDAGPKPTTPASKTKGPSPRPPKPPLDGEQPPDRERAKTLAREGSQLLNQGNLTEAQKRFDLALDADPRNSLAVTGLAQVAFEKSNYPRAVELAHRAISLQSTHPQAYLLLGDAYFNLGRFTNARNAWEKAQKQDPTNTVIHQRFKQLDGKTD